jgi:hypothetical protein
MKSLFCCISLLLFTNCATIFFGKKEYIQIKTNVANPTIKINDVVVPKANDTLEKLAIYLSKRIGRPFLELSAPGYEAVKFEFTRTPLKMYRHPKRVLRIISIITLASGFNLVDGYYNPLLPLAILTVFGLPYGTSYLVDNSTQAANTFSFKQIELNLNKIQQPITNKETPNLLCTSFSLTLKPNDIVGHVYESKHRKFNHKTDITWNNETLLRAQELVEKANKVLKELNCLGSEDSLTKPPIVLKGNLIELEYDVFIHDNTLDISSANSGREDVIYNSLMDKNLITVIKWTLYNNVTNQPVFEKTIRAQCWDDKQGFQKAAAKNISQSIKLLLEEEGIQSIIQKGN